MKDAIKHYDNARKKIEEYSLSKRAKENIMIFYTNALILKLRELKPEEQKEFIKEINERKMIKNIKVRNIKQLIKRIVLNISIKAYLKIERNK